MRKSIWNAIERKLDDYSLRKKFYIFYVLCVMLPLIVTDSRYKDAGDDRT